MNPIKYSYNKKSEYNTFKLPFSGHPGHETLRILGESSSVITETRFFRDYETLRFAVNYINKTFNNLKMKNFIVGACSTGEEVMSLKMLMDKHPVKILGFDIGEETLNKAKSEIFEMYIPSNNITTKYTKTMDINTYNDSFLVKDINNLSNEQIYLKKLFNKYFESRDSKYKLIYKISEKFRKQFSITFAEFDKRKCRLKTRDENIEYKLGDIRTLEKIVPQKQKFQLFSFKNAFYHILTNNNNYFREIQPTNKTEPILNNIFRKINKILDKEGLFIMGEEEHNQKCDIHAISKALLKNGFLPIRMPNKPYLNIWKKVKESK